VAPDGVLYRRLERALPTWSSHTVKPVTQLRLWQCMTELASTGSQTTVGRQTARRDILAVLSDLQCVVNSPEPVSRGVRQLRHAIRVRRQTCPKLILAVWEYALLVLIVGIAAAATTGH